MIGPPSDLPGLAPGGRASPRAWGKFKRHFWGRSLRHQHEEAFGWIKTVAGLRKTRFCGLARVDLAFTFAAAAYNLVRLPKLLAGAPP